MSNESTRGDAKPSDTCLLPITKTICGGGKCRAFLTVPTYCSRHHYQGLKFVQPNTQVKKRRVRLPSISSLLRSSRKEVCWNLPGTEKMHNLIFIPRCYKQNASDYAKNRYEPAIPQEILTSLSE